MTVSRPPGFSQLPPECSPSLICGVKSRSGHDRSQSFGQISHVSGPKLTFWGNFIMVLHGFAWRSSKYTVLKQKKQKNHTNNHQIRPKTQQIIQNQWTQRFSYGSWFDLLTMVRHVDKGPCRWLYLVKRGRGDPRQAPQAPCQRVEPLSINFRLLLNAGWYCWPDYLSHTWSIFKRLVYVLGFC